jgi:hypothetical protein
MIRGLVDFALHPRFPMLVVVASVLSEEAERR